MLLGNYELKQPNTTCLLKWLKSKTLTTSSAGEDVEKQEISFFVSGSTNGIESLWKTVWQFLKK